MNKNEDTINYRDLPDTTINTKNTFNISKSIDVPAYSKPDQYVPAIDPTYHFDEETTMAILAGFQHNRRVLIQGLHGTGKSTHIEQVAARLNWRCIRINLDSHVSRIDLIGKYDIVLRRYTALGYSISNSSRI